MSGAAQQLPAILTPILAQTDQREGWRYANVTGLERLNFGAPQAADAFCKEGAVKPQTDGVLLLSVNGFWQVPQNLPEAVVATLEGSKLTLKITADIDLEWRLVMAEKTNLVAAHVALHLDIAPNVRVQLFEQPESIGAPSLQMSGFSADLGEDAALNHARVQNLLDGDYIFSRNDVNVAARARYHFFTLTLGAKQSRQQMDISLNGVGADAELHGIYRLHNTQHADHGILVRHAAPDCTSRQNFRGIVHDSARGSFQGKIAVERVAQGTNAHQLHKGMILGERAEISAKPELEIFADAVKCSHGATLGTIDEAALFYLRARGISEEQARHMLVDAFVSGILEDAPFARAQLGAALGAQVMDEADAQG